jgi:hypothetical protein
VSEFGANQHRDEQRLDDALFFDVSSASWLEGNTRLDHRALWTVWRS